MASTATPTKMKRKPILWQFYWMEMSIFSVLYGLVDARLFLVLCMLELMRGALWINKNGIIEE